MARALRRFRSSLKALASAMLIGFAADASSQNLTASEVAALSERGPTLAEKNRKTQECQIKTVPDQKRGPISMDVGFEGRVVYLPPMRGLLISWIAYEGPEKGTFALVPPVELPLGGIAGFDFCGVMTLIETRAVEKRGDALRYQTLRLRSALDLEVDYPTAYSVITEKRLLLTSPSSRYVEVLTDEPEDFTAWLDANKQKTPWLLVPYPIIAFSDRVFVPTR
ncbi:MAG: hypothetical protein AAF393_18735 [Pseudomonadota bacterium]